MDKSTVLYQLMDIRINEVLDKITANDDEYQATVRESDSCAGKLDALDLSDDARNLIDQYISAHNANGCRYGELAYVLGFSDCLELLFGIRHAPSIKKHSGF